MLQKPDGPCQGDAGEASVDTKRIAILTGGGDCPGLNAVIRAAVKTGRGYGWDVYGVRNGFEGLRRVDTLRLSRERIKGILPVGGTILGSTNKINPFAVKIGDQVEDQSELVLDNFREEGFDALIAIGGDGTQRIAQRFFELGLPVVGVPKTIDNDVGATDVTFGFDTAVETATDAIDKLHPTAESHQRVLVVEMMGRTVGWIALHAGIAGGADVILIPEIPFDVDAVCAAVERRYNSDRNFAIVVVAEGARPVDGQLVEVEAAPRTLMGSPLCNALCEAIAAKTGREVRGLVLGHLQRGGSPTTYDRVLGSRYGAAAVRLIRDGRFGEMVALRGNQITSVKIAEAIARVREVDVAGDTVQTARDLGISFGDRT
ncbi:MAG: 6-phosphofructokinase [Myxococcales bacterium]|nr:6-phosphofructokinase [Myxococcales bacterium]